MSVPSHPLFVGTLYRDIGSPYFVPPPSLNFVKLLFSSFLNTLWCLNTNQRAVIICTVHGQKSGSQCKDSSDFFDVNVRVSNTRQLWNTIPRFLIQKNLKFWIK